MSLLSNTARGHKGQRDSPEDCASDHPPVKKRYQDRVNKSRWAHTPRFYDTLSKVWLTRGALIEFDRRIIETKRLQQAPPSEILSSSNRPLTRLATERLEDFARNGGPDLTYLRGFANSSAETGYSSTSPGHNGSRSDRSFSSSMRKSGIYDADYEQKLEDAGVYIENQGSNPVNWQEIRDRLGVSRASLSSSKFGDDEFKEFQKEAARSAGNEAMVMRYLIPRIEGYPANPGSSGGELFSNVEEFTKEVTAAKPDLYDGALREKIHARVRSDLDQRIIPSKQSHTLVAPNCFTEVKSSSGRDDVVKRQACHDGAIGARAMHSLQNYGREIPTYDKKAYALSNTYHSGTGTLLMYTTHPTAPKAPGENPEYHMTPLNSYAITGNIKNFKEGVTAYRNGRDLCTEYRDDLIEHANTVAARMPANAPSSQTNSSQLTSSSTSRSTQSATDSDTSSDESVRKEEVVK